MLGRPAGMAAAGCAILLCGVLFWRFRREPAGSSQFNFALISALVVTTLVLPNAGGGTYYNDVLLIPAAVWLLTSGRELASAGRSALLVWVVAVSSLAGAWILALAVSCAAFVFHYNFPREETLMAGGPELMLYAFPLMIALFALMAAPRLCWPGRNASS